jgi:3',5'-cyclic AMP phosphodiesterase CpdA
MATLAHLTDLHLNGTASRREKFIGALQKAVTLGANHLLLTGDLTAHGNRDHFVELAGCLTHWPHGATIVGGNHDGDYFRVAIRSDGALGRFAHTSVAGVATQLDDLTILPVDTFVSRRALLFRALGMVGDDQISKIDRVCQDARRPVVIAMHHGPQAEPLRAFASLVDARRFAGLLARHPHVSVCCGHDHRIIDQGSVHVAAAVAHHPDPLRLYRVVNGVLQAIYTNGELGYYFE